MAGAADCGRRHAAQPRLEPPPDALRRLHRYLLSDDGPRERAERIAAAADGEAVVARNYLLQERVARGERLGGFEPVRRRIGSHAKRFWTEFSAGHGGAAGAARRSARTGATLDP